MNARRCRLLVGFALAVMLLSLPAGGTQKLPGLVMVGGDHGLFAQNTDEPSGARVVEFRSEPQPASFGEPFELQLVLRFPSEGAVVMPDTLVPTDAAASAGAGRWSVEEAVGDSVDVLAVYPVLPFRSGRVELPWLPLDDLIIPIGAVEVAPLAVLEEAEGELQPRPFADVLGGEWSPWAIAAAGFAAIGLTWMLGIAASRWRQRMSAGGERAVEPASARASALSELEQLRSSGLAEDGRMREFYARGTEVLRRYSAAHEPAWGTFLTSSELTERYRARWGDERVRRVADAVETAERVKFGGAQPDVQTALTHWEAIRDWVRDGASVG